MTSRRSRTIWVRSRRHIERIAILDLYSDYALCLDERRFEDWPGLVFAESCRYEVQSSRENRATSACRAR